LEETGTFALARGLSAVAEILRNALDYQHFYAHSMLMRGASFLRKQLPLAAALTFLVLARSGLLHAEEGCTEAIATAEQAASDLPAGLLRAIGAVESGRRDPVTGQFGAWPWSVNASGDSRVFETRRDAVAFVEDARARGIRSIDVGCMQVNLMYHPNAFVSLDEAFDPNANVRYAIAFLRDLRQRTGDWMRATGSYHSATPGLSDAYAERVRSVLTGVASVGALWTRPAIRLASADRLGTATHGAIVIVPGATPIYQVAVPGPLHLPRVYRP
jgi:Transglycosylase SLT domain